MSIDLAAYFARIGYTGARTATLQALREIVSAHTRAIPFENLDPLSGRPVELSLAALQSKLVHERRGGYCFEHNLLLADVLRQIGFEVTGLAARVLWNAPDAVLPRTHMLLCVRLDGHAHIVDVGFGGLTLTGVLRLEPGLEQVTPHEPFRLLREADEYILQAQVLERWRALYRFDLQAQAAVDYEPVNWYLSTHPRSKFVTTLVAARAEPGRRFALLNNRLSVHEVNGLSTRSVLGSAAELRAVLENEFRIDVPRSACMEEALERIAATREPREAAG